MANEDIAKNLFDRWITVDKNRNLRKALLQMIKQARTEALEEAAKESEITFDELRLFEGDREGGAKIAKAIRNLAKEER